MCILNKTITTTICIQMLRKFQLKVGGNEMRFVFSNASNQSFLNQSFIVTLDKDMACIHGLQQSSAH